MPGFFDQEKVRQVALKPAFFSPAACEHGVYDAVRTPGTRYPFCLHEHHAAENLLPALRDDAISYATSRGIPWHGGHGGQPSNHLCSSQVACVNTLFPLVRDASTLAAVFRPFLPQLSVIAPFTEDKPLPAYTATDPAPSPALAFEWIGAQNYLGERSWGTRGAAATSADFAFRFRRYDGRIELVLGEWKYTVQYTTHLAPPEQLNTTRLATYRDAYARWKAVQPDLPPYEVFFSDPFYQLMRLTLLAQAMEADGKLGADIVSVVHVAPTANRGFGASITSPTLKPYGRTVSAIWAQIAPAGRFVAVSAESLLTVIELAAPPPLHPWRDDLLRRYGWWR